jgi:transposase-like protein
MTRQVNQVLWDQWRQRIHRQRESGLSIAEFCRREGVSAHGFYVWRRNLRQTASKRHEPRADAKLQRSRRRGAAVTSRRRRGNALVGSTAPACPTNFLQLPVTTAQAAPWIELAMADGTILRLPQQNLAALITALRVLRGERLELPWGERRDA